MFHSMRLLFIVLSLLLANQISAAEKKYGSFILNTDIPDTLFFIDDIERNDSFELRKALRNHSIKNIVLASRGGNVFEGLQMAGIIFDKKLRTYVPRGGKCASACAFLFFAGNERLVDGALGVHQAYSSDGTKKQAVGQTQYATQFTVSEIIGFLNEFGTPAFVYERMFQDIDMYFFDPVELLKLNSASFELDNGQKLEITKFITKKLGEQKEKKKEEEKKPKLTAKEVVVLIQKRLQEIGCNPGPADGVWGRRTQAAAVLFAKTAKLPTGKDDLISEDFFKKLESAPAMYCPKTSKPTVPVHSRFLNGSWKLVNTCGAVVSKRFTMRRLKSNKFKSKTVSSLYLTSGDLDGLYATHNLKEDAIQIAALRYSRLKNVSGKVYRKNLKGCYVQISQ